MKLKSLLKSSVAILVFSYYSEDPRVRREAEALCTSGMSVDVVCLRKSSERNREIINGVHVYRLPIQRKRTGKLRYLWQYTYFGFLAFFAMSVLGLRRRYDLVHVHNMPDFLVFSALIPRVAGAKLILDLHDPMPEVFMTKYCLSESHPVVRFLVMGERLSILFSNLVLTPNIAFRDLFISRGCPKDKIHIVMNSPQETIFQTNNKKVKKNGKGKRSQFTIMYHGTISEWKGLNTALKAINLARDQIPNIVFDVYGEGDFVQAFLEYVEELNLKDVVSYHGHVSLENIARAIETKDVGLIPNNSSPFANINLPTRIFEYLCMRKPVIVSRTKGVLDYFYEESLHYVEPGSAESLAERIIEVYKNPSRSRAVLERGIAVYQAHRWEVERQHFVELITDLIGANPSQAKA